MKHVLTETKEPHMYHASPTAFGVWEPLHAQIKSGNLMHNREIHSYQHVWNVRQEHCWANTYVVNANIYLHRNYPPTENWNCVHPRHWVNSSACLVQLEVQCLKCTNWYLTRKSRSCFKHSQATELQILFMGS
jgi:hypothetical protein